MSDQCYMTTVGGTHSEPADALVASPIIPKRSRKRGHQYQHQHHAHSTDKHEGSAPELVDVL